jgi:hypothetical protein
MEVKHGVILAITVQNACSVSGKVDGGGGVVVSWFEGLATNFRWQK